MPAIEIVEPVRTEDVMLFGALDALRRTSDGRNLMPFDLRNAAARFPESQLGRHYIAEDALRRLSFAELAAGPDQLATLRAEAEEVIGDSFLADRIASALAHAEYRQARATGWGPQLKLAESLVGPGSEQDPAEAREALRRAGEIQREAAAAWLQRERSLGDFERLGWAQRQVESDRVIIAHVRDVMLREVPGSDNARP